MKNKADVLSQLENIPPQESAPLDGGWRKKLQARRVARAIPQLTDRRSLPLSFAQERLWLLERLEPGSPAYNRPLALRLSGLLNEAALRRALQAIVDRHEVLRTRFTTREGQPEQVISPCLLLDLHVIKHCAEGPAEREAQARRLAAEESLRPFDLAHEPTLRATLLRSGSEDHILLLVFHHIVFDGWSARVFRRELTSLYRNLQAGESPALTELPIQYADFAHWQRQVLGEQARLNQLNYWTTRLQGSVPLDLPTDRPRPGVQTHRGGCIEIILSESLANSLKALGRQENATLFMVLLAAFQSLLARYAGLEDVSVGTPVAGRNWVETESLIGIFINILVLRSDLAGNLTFRQLLARVRETCCGAYCNQDLSFAQLVEELQPQRDLSITPLFQVMFNLENLPEFGGEIPGLRVEEFEFERPVANYELTLEVVPLGGQLKCFFIYNADIFDRGTIERMAGNYRTLLEGIVAEPDCHLALLPLLSAANRHQILVEWNRTEADYPRDATIHQLFEAQAARTPEAAAFFSDSGNLSYGDLDRRSNQLARHLRTHGAGPESFVGVCLERSPEAVVALMAILKAGAAFVPLDPAYPPDRLAFMIADAQIPLVVSLRKWLPLVRGKGARVICLDADHRLIDAQQQDNLPGSTGPESLAYVLYTSGSSGVPKGVLGLHRGAVNRFTWMWKNFPFQPGEVCSLKTSFNFGDSIWEVFGPLLRGVPSVIVSDQTVRDPAELIQTLASYAVTRIVTVPSLLRAVLGSYPDLGNRLPSLKLWVSSGEPLLPDLCRQFYQAMPNAALLNLYGSTEVSADVTAHVVPATQDDREAISLGRPIDNTRCYVLDGQLQPVPIGVHGDLYIGGEGLARGYYNRPELTAERFIANPFSAHPQAQLYKTGDRVRYLPDGSLQYLGRSDQQVKIRGFRVEMGEIESILTQHPAVSAAAVTVREGILGEKHLVAYVVPRQSADPPTPKALRDFLKQKLPDYMVPANFITQAALPLTPTGKVDARALAAPSQSPPQTGSRYVAPVDPEEWQLAKIWEEILGVRPIGIEDNFFDLGGNSLLAIRMMDRIEDAYGKRLPVAALFAEATVQHLVECLCAETLKEAGSAIVPVQPLGSRPPLFFLHGDFNGGLYCRTLARVLGQDQPLYGVMPSGFDGKPYLPTVEAMAEENVGQLVALQPQGPYLLGGYCNGGLVAYEMARQLTQKGLEVGLVVLVDTWVPRQIGWLKALVRGGGALARLDVDTQATVYRRLRNYLAVTHKAYRQGLRALLTLYLQKARRILVGLLGAPPEKLGGAMTPPDDPLEFRRYSQIGRILAYYRPKPYQGRLVLLRTRCLELSYPTDQNAGWGKLAPQIEVQMLPGDHSTCLTEHIGDVAEHIAKCLREYHQETDRLSSSAAGGCQFT